MSDDIAPVVALSEASEWFNSDGIELKRERLSDDEGGHNDIRFALVNGENTDIYILHPQTGDGTWNI